MDEAAELFETDAQKKARKQQKLLAEQERLNKITGLQSDVQLRTQELLRRYGIGRAASPMSGR